MNAAAIKDAISKLERADRKLTVFGAASTHQWRLRPPASAAEVNKFEKRFGVALPDDYREFLCSVGNGGAGPQYGLFPLGVFSEQSERADNLIGELSEPFPAGTILRPQVDRRRDSDLSRGLRLLRAARGDRIRTRSHLDRRSRERSGNRAVREQRGQEADVPRVVYSMARRMPAKHKLP
jgi:hypothetical protein